MKTITTKKETCEIFGTKSTVIFVNDIPVIRLTNINGKKCGYDSSYKYSVHNYKNELGLSWGLSVARTIKQVINHLSK